MRLVVILIEYLSRTRIVMRDGDKIKVFLMILPFFAISYLNTFPGAFLAGMIGGGVNVFACAVVIKWFEQETGMDYDKSYSFERNFYHKVNALKIVLLFIVGLISILLFSKINPVRLIYISGLPYG